MHRHCRMLILDDNPHMRVLLRTIARSAGIRDTIEAGDAVTAFESLRMSVPDLAIVDYNLGDLNGLEFTRLVRTADDSPCPELPIIMVTAHAHRAIVQEAIDAGVNEFALKPVSTATLLDRIQAVTERPRPFIRTSSYYGPDRRRRDDPNYRGPERRGRGGSQRSSQAAPDAAPDRASDAPSDAGETPASEDGSKKR